MLLIDCTFYSEDILLPSNELGRGIENNIQQQHYTYLVVCILFFQLKIHSNIENLEWLLSRKDFFHTTNWPRNNTKTIINNFLISECYFFNLEKLDTLKISHPPPRLHPHYTPSLSAPCLISSKDFPSLITAIFEKSHLCPRCERVRLQFVVWTPKLVCGHLKLCGYSNHW